METNVDNQNYPEHIETIFEFKIPKGKVPERLDSYLTNAIFNATRNRVQKAIDDGRVTINGIVAKSSKKIQPNDHIICKIMKAPPIELLPQNIPLDVIFEDGDLIVVNKPPDMCTHPGFGHRYGTLVNAVLYHFGLRNSISMEGGFIDDEDEENEDNDEMSEGEIFASDEIRPGIVHRLDKDTSGVLVIAKNPEVHAKLSKQFADRTTERQYYALVWGKFKEDEGIIEGDIGRSQKNRKLYAVVKKNGKPAKTSYTVIERFPFATLLKLKLFTGRTHQIRVHLAHHNHPVFGDTFYGGDKIVAGGMPEINQIASKCLSYLNRHLLHAKTLGFNHPVKNEFMSFDSNLPLDFETTLNMIRDWSDNYD